MLRLTDKMAQPPKLANEATIREQVTRLSQEIGDYQLRLYAESKKSLLVILQGMDASGKDGAIKNVFEALNPMGCRVYSFKKPTEQELAHDFLWRIHALTPPAGMIYIFNRSHYEDILVPSVEGYIPKKEIAKRFDQINDFERMLEANGTTVVKFFLHVSYKEQEVRLRERMTNPKKFWKHSDGDWETRKKWAGYMKVYQALLNRCNQVPWYVVPSDKNWYKEFLVADAVLKALKKINPKYPPLETAMKVPVKSSPGASKL